MATIITSILAGGTNNYATVSAQANAVATDFINQGCVGTLASTSGIAPSTGSFAVNQDASPDMGVTLTAGVAYISATPSSQSAQVLRASMAANATSYTINANSSGSTKYDWIYLSVNATNANNPDSAGDNVTSIVTSRSTSNTADNGSPPTYGIPLAIVTVANGASSITNANIADTRVQATPSISSTTSLYNYENSFDHVASGAVITGDSYASTLNGSMTAGVAYIGGVRVIIPSFSAHAFTASRDTYIYVDNTGTLTFTAQTNNNSGGAPALPANSILLGIVISGASAIASAADINQGQETIVLPIVSSIAYTVTESNGNLICPRDPQRRLLGFKPLSVSYPTGLNATSAAAVAAGLSCPVIIPTGRKARVTFFARDVITSGGALYVHLQIWNGIVGSGTEIGESQGYGSGGGISIPVSVVGIQTVAGAQTFNAGYFVSANSINIEGSISGQPAFIMVELV